MNKKQICAYLKKYWMLLPFLFCLFLQLMAWFIEGLTGSVLRSAPQMILYWLMFFSVMILILGASWMFFQREDKKELKIFSVVKVIWYSLLGVIGIAAMFIGFFFSAFTYIPEHVVVHNGVRKVACVHSFLKEKVYYYEYRGILFRGSKEIGYEYYGNGGGDPLEDDREPIQQYWGE